MKMILQNKRNNQRKLSLCKNKQNKFFFAEFMKIGCRVGSVVFAKIGVGSVVFNSSLLFFHLLN